MKIGYARVSSISQGKYGCSLEDQIEKLKAAGCEKIVSDVFTGKSMDRPEFTKMIATLVPGDELVTCKLDRFARTLVDGVQTIQELFDRGITVNVLNMGIVDDTTVGKLILSIMLSFAEYERSLISERCQAGRAIARSNPNYKEGRKRSYTTVQEEHIIELAAAGKSYSQIARMTGISKTTIFRIMQNHSSAQDI